MEPVKIINLFLRLLTLASKFILVIYISKYLSLEEFGLYSLIAVSISYYIYIVGFDFYTYSSRELLLSDSTHWPKFLKNQFSLYIVSYILIIPLVFLLFFSKLIPYEYIFIFYFLLILEHLSQEIMRLLVIMKKPVYANFILFLRVGFWIYISILVMFKIPEYNELSTVLLFWFLGLILSLLFSLKGLTFVSWYSVLKAKIDLSWIYTGIKVALPLLLATLSLRAIYTMDRYIIQWFGGVSDVGVYSFFSSFANALLSFIDAAVIVQHYPRVVSSFKSTNKENISTEIQVFFKAILKFGCVISLGLGITVPFLPTILDKPELNSYLYVFYILLVSVFIYCLGLIPHYVLYAKQKDSKIIISSVLALAVGGVSMMLLGYYWGISGVATGQLMAVLTLSGSKFFFSKERK